MEICQGIIDCVLCWLKLVLLWLSVPVGLSLMYRYCGAYYVLQRKEKQQARRKAKENVDGSNAAV